MDIEKDCDLNKTEKELKSEKSNKDISEVIDGNVGRDDSNER
jgi:hypothetical protein